MDGYKTEEKERRRLLLGSAVAIASRKDRAVPTRTTKATATKWPCKPDL